MEAVGIVAKLLRAQVRAFSFAGNKDKRAVTTQKVTAQKINASKLAALNSRLIGLRLGDFKYVPGHLMLGDLNGNRFTVFLR
jgi:tRNA pseudouridine13 synthase